ncbi:MAG: NAD-dependent epimerase/dehydratase family protein, partial [Pseudomonadota bacterium]|nr:NAD-dependent epimerase/dehydratase family protein [Pseudomonadota bacterium]
DPEKMMQTNIAGTQNILKAAAKCGVEKIIYTSSVAALGNSASGNLVDENTPSKLEDKIGTYKQSKFLAEAKVIEMHKRLGLPVVIVNPSAPIGPGDIKPTPTGKLVIQAASGKIPAYVDSGLNIVHVDDVAEGHYLALKNGRNGEKYILGGVNLSFLEILTIIANIVGKSKPLFKIPYTVALPIAHLVDIWAKYFFVTEPFITVDGVKMSRKPMYYSSQKAIKELGYCSRPVGEAFSDAINWYKSHGYIK